jgi:hypothetical protein
VNGGSRDYHIGPQAHELGGQPGELIHLAGSVALLEDDIAPLDVAQFVHPLTQRIEQRRRRFPRRP